MYNKLSALPCGHDEIGEKAEGLPLLETFDFEARGLDCVVELAQPEHRVVPMIGLGFEIPAEEVFERFGRQFFDKKATSGFRHPGDFTEAVPPFGIVMELPEDKNRVEAGLVVIEPGQ